MAPSYIDDLPASLIEVDIRPDRIPGSASLLVSACHCLTKIRGGWARTQRQVVDSRDARLMSHWPVCSLHLLLLALRQRRRG